MGNKRDDITIKRIIQRCGCDLILPFALVYVFYIILHGHLSPGGGFQGGVMMTAVVVLVYLGHGYETTIKALSFHRAHVAEGFMSVVYVFLAMAGVVVGAAFCENIFFAQGDIGAVFSSGTVFWMNITVGLKVLFGVCALTLTMLGLLSFIDVDYKK